MHDDPVDHVMPLDPDEHAAQIAYLLRTLNAGDRVVDVGAGLGRIAIPLAEQGVDVLAIDNDPSWLEGVGRATADLERPVVTRCADVLDVGADLAHPSGASDNVLILGNTLALFHDPMECVALFQRLRGTLSPGGALYIDHLHSVVWREVREGYWQEGVSEDGDMQMVWEEGDCVIALRTGEGVDPSSDRPGASDARMRLWSWGALQLLARCAGFSDPEALPDAHLVRFRAD